MNQKLHSVAEEKGKVAQRAVADSPASHVVVVPRTPAAGLDALIRASNLPDETSISAPVAGPSTAISTSHVSPLSITHTSDHGTSPSHDPVAGSQRGDSEFPPATRSPETEGYFGPSSTFNFVTKVLPEGSHQHNDVQGDYNNGRISTIAASQEPPFPYAQIILGTSDEGRTVEHDLPERAMADSLLDAYFNCVHRLYPFVHESTFRNQYERLWQPSLPEAAKFSPEWLAILNMTFAYGCEFSDTIDREQMLPMASVFVSRARTLLLPRLFLPGSLERVQALLLLCHYLQGTLELCECWNLVGVMIRTAVSIGLHLPVTNEQSRDAVQREMVKRVWCGCYVIDRTLSMKFGRPPSIQILNVHEMPLPLEVDDMYITRETLVPRQPTGRPSMTGFFMQTIKLTDIVDHVLKELYNGSNLKSNTMQELDPVLRAANQYRVLGATASVDARLLSWWNLVPKYLREEPEISDGVDFRRQRNVIYIRFLNLRTLLHRQALLIYSQQNIHDPFQRSIAIASSKACILASKQTIRLIHSQYYRQLLNSITYNLHYVFTAMGVLLTLETMDETRLKALDETSYREVLDLGMEFLLATSNLSKLAGRYVMMLQKLRSSGHVLSKPSRGADMSLVVESNNQGGSSNNSSTEGLNNSIPIASAAASSRTTATSSPWMGQPLQAQTQVPNGCGLDLNSQQNLETELLDIDFNDFLYGTGLPRDFITGQWSSFE
ncbi:fungal-specific transcription factor domain-containing protein [Xylogone sp. PMI_703]|nr:fungal-specific transcription factor domain-containing protein [Xylogone sp. PMI_703]